MPGLYKDILKNMNEEQKLLDDSGRNLPEMKRLVSRERAHEPEI